MFSFHGLVLLFDQFLVNLSKYTTLTLTPLDQADLEKNNTYKQLVKDATDNGTFYALSCTVTGVRSDSYNDFLRALRRHYADGATRNAAFPRTFACPDYVSYLVQVATVSVLNETGKTLDAAVKYAQQALPTFRNKSAELRKALLVSGHPY